jgi:hypothetical protein
LLLLLLLQVHLTEEKVNDRQRPIQFFAEGERCKYLGSACFGIRMVAVMALDVQGHSRSLCRSVSTYCTEKAPGETWAALVTLDI